MLGSASTRRWSASLLINRIWPIDGLFAWGPKNGLELLARYSAVAWSRRHPSRIGLGSIRGAPRPAGRISNSTCGAIVLFDPGPIRPRIVPAITLDPTLS